MFWWPAGRKRLSISKNVDDDKAGVQQPPILHLCTYSKLYTYGRKECSNLLYLDHGHAQDVFDGSYKLAGTTPKSHHLLLKMTRNSLEYRRSLTIKPQARSMMTKSYDRFSTHRPSGKNTPNPPNQDPDPDSSKTDT